MGRIDALLMLAFWSGINSAGLDTQQGDRARLSQFVMYIVLSAVAIVLIAGKYVSVSG